MLFHKKHKVILNIVQNVHKIIVNYAIFSQVNDVTNIFAEDGNCLYDATVKSTGIDMTHEELRKKICDFLLQLPVEFKVR